MGHHSGDMRHGSPGGHARLIASALVAALAAGVAAAPASAAPPEPVLPGFQDVALVSGVPAPVAVRFAPNGRIFVADKGGRVFAFDEPRDPTPQLVIDLSIEVHDFWDRGLLGMALDPGFAVNRRLYLLYTRNRAIGATTTAWPDDDCPGFPGGNGCVVSGRLVRVTLDELGVASQPEPVIEDEWCQQFPSHSIGTVAFGPDGMLYAGAGDGAMWAPPDYGQHGNPCEDPMGDPPSLARAEGGSLRSQDLRGPTVDPLGFDGAIVRVDPASTHPGNEPEIVAYGMRNPYRFTFRPGTTELWIGDVGEASWEEVNRVDGAAGGVENLGWPCFEGWGELPVFSDTNLCMTLARESVTMPRFVYPHGEPAVEGGDGCHADAAASGSSLAGIAFGGSGAYPAEYDGALFFGDYSRNCIWVALAGANGQPDFGTVRAFAAGAPGIGVTDLQIDPHGDLVYAYYDPYDAGKSEIRRIRSSASNAAPVATLTASETYGALPLAVEFDASHSSDPDADPIDIAWDLDGDGEYDDGTGTTEQQTYTTAENRTVRVRVRDPFGETDVAEVLVSPGNTPPVATFSSPQAGARWAAGETLALRGSGQDAESATTLTWTVVLQHCEPGGGCHGHPLQTLHGAEQQLTAPEHDHPSHLSVTLTATDARGLTHAVTRELHPRTVTVSAATDPAGLTVGLSAGGEGLEQTIIEGASVVLSAPSPQWIGTREHRFASWSDGSTAAERTLKVTRDTRFVARFEAPVPAATATPTGAADTAPPALRLSAPRTQRLRAGRLRLRATCPQEACRVTVAPRLRLGARALGLARTTRRLAAGRAANVVLRLPAARRRAVALALRRGRTVTVRLEVVATDAAGNRARPRRLTVRLVR